MSACALRDGGCADFCLGVDKAVTLVVAGKILRQKCSILCCPH